MCHVVINTAFWPVFCIVARHAWGGELSSLHRIMEIKDSDMGSGLREALREWPPRNSDGLHGVMQCRRRIPSVQESTCYFVEASAVLQAPVDGRKVSAEDEGARLLLPD